MNVVNVNILEEDEADGSLLFTASLNGETLPIGLAAPNLNFEVDMMRVTVNVILTPHEPPEYQPPV